jgi:hypothetical protein
MRFPIVGENDPLHLWPVPDSQEETHLDRTRMEVVVKLSLVRRIDYASYLQLRDDHFLDEQIRSIVADDDTTEIDEDPNLSLNPEAELAKQDHHRFLVGRLEKARTQLVDHLVEGTDDFFGHVAV